MLFPGITGKTVGGTDFPHTHLDNRSKLPKVMAQDTGYPRSVLSKCIRRKAKWKEKNMNTFLVLGRVNGSRIQVYMEGGKSTAVSLCFSSSAK